MKREHLFVTLALVGSAMLFLLSLGVGQIEIGLLTAFLPAVALASPVPLALAAVMTGVLVNGGWLPVPDTLRFGLLGLLCATLFMAVLSGRRRNVLPGVVTPISCLLILVAFASLGAGSVSLLRGVAFALLLMVLALFPQVVSIASIVRTWRTLFLLLAIYLLIGTAVRFALSPGSVIRSGVLRGSMENPNAFGLLAGATAVYFAIAGERAQLSPTMRRAIVLLLLLAVVASGCRTAELGLATLLLIRMTKGSHGRRATALGAIAVLGLFLGQQFLVEATREERLVVWVRATTFALEHPLHGVGFGGTEAAILTGRLEVPPEFQGSQLHNSYVQALYEFGLIPGVLFLGLLGALVRRSLRRDRLVQGLTPLRGVVIFGLVSAIAESWMFSTGSAFGALFWLAVSCLWLEHRHERQRAYQAVVPRSVLALTASR